MAKQDMYPGADEPMDKESDAQDSKDKPSKEDRQTALLPLKFFEGQELKPGQEYYVTVERVFEDEVEVSYPHKEDEEKESKEHPMKEANDALEGMATENPGNPGGGMGY